MAAAYTRWRGGRAIEHAAQAGLEEPVHVIAQIEEILDRYDSDGLFIDIVRYIGASCVCATCLAQIVEQGVEPEDPAQLRAFTLAAERRFMDRVTAAIRVIPYAVRSFQEATDWSRANLRRWPLPTKSATRY